jgi:hypothetical protein
VECRRAPAPFAPQSAVARQLLQLQADLGEGEERGDTETGSWSSGTRERREVPKNEGGEAGVLILREGTGELLEGLR